MTDSEREQLLETKKAVVAVICKDNGELTAIMLGADSCLDSALTLETAMGVTIVGLAVHCYYPNYQRYGWDRS
jgi:hypothetical protein